MTRLSCKTFLLAALALTVASAGLLMPTLSTDAADHGDAPYNASDQAIDGADAYAFLDPTDNTRVILALTSRGFIAAGENNNFGQFDPAVRYRFEIETTGDPRPDRFINITFSRRTGVTAPQTATVTLMNGQSFTALTTPPSLCIAGSANCPPVATITDFTSSSGVVRFFAGMLNTANTSIGTGETVQTTGYAGFPNGRRPGDDVVDVLLYFIANQQAITDNANANEVTIPTTFPFFPAPHQPRPAGTGAEDQTRN